MLLETKTGWYRKISITCDRGQYNSTKMMERFISHLHDSPSKHIPGVIHSCVFLEPRLIPSCCFVVPNMQFVSWAYGGCSSSFHHMHIPLNRKEKGIHEFLSFKRHAAHPKSSPLSSHMIQSHDQKQLGERLVR